LATRLAIP